MKRIKIILSVTTLVMTLFIFCLITTTKAAIRYEEGYTPLTNQSTYVDEIKFDQTRGTINTNYFCECAKMAHNANESFMITRIRRITGETNTNILKTIADFRDRYATFEVQYNGEKCFSFKFPFNSLFSNCEIDHVMDINFNDPNDINYQNVERIIISEPETSVYNYYSNVNTSRYEGYEDFILIKTYDVTEIQEIVNSPLNLPSKDVLTKKDIELSSGIKIEGKDNICYGGNYNKEEGKLIDNGVYYLKVIATYNDIKYHIVYKITVTDMISELPRIYITTNRQLTASEIDNHILENNITNYTYDASTYFQFFNVPGIYYINISYNYDDNKYNAKFPVYVTDKSEQKLKTIDNELLKVGYNNKLNQEDFIANLDFSYIEVDEYNIDYSAYDNNSGNVGSYDVSINIRDIYGILYYQVVTIEVYDNICPNVELKEDTKLEYSYLDIVDIEKIINQLEINDISEYSVKHDASNYLNRTDKIGEFVIDVLITDEYLNSTNYQITLKIIDDVVPKIITKPIYASTEVKLDVNTIKSKIYVVDEIDGIISINNIDINDINGYKDNYNIPGTYHFEVIARDNTLNEAYSSFDIIVTDEVIEELNVINIDRNNPFTKEEILSYLIENGYLNPNSNYELVSDYFNTDTYDLDTYSLEITDINTNEKKYFEIKINDSNVKYESMVITDEEKKSNNSSIIIVIAIIAILGITSVILGVVIYKKKH